MGAFLGLMAGLGLLLIWHGLSATGAPRSRRPPFERTRERLIQAGLPGVSPVQLFALQGLSAVLSSRFQQAEAIRYSMKYKSIKRNGNRAFVDVLVDASFSVTNARGVEVRADMRDQNQFILEWDGKQWLFLSGM